MKGWLPRWLKHLEPDAPSSWQGMAGCVVGFALFVGAIWLVGVVTSPLLSGDQLVWVICGGALASMLAYSMIGKDNMTEVGQQRLVLFCFVAAFLCVWLFSR